MSNIEPVNKLIAESLMQASSGIDEDERRRNAALFVEMIETLIDDKIRTAEFFGTDFIVPETYLPASKDIVNPDLKCVCIRCDKELENISDRSLQPNDGLAFVTTGHYGTTFFDPMDGSKLEVVVCDECLRNHFKVKSI